MSQIHPPVVLFVCTGNAGRSQMAEALMKPRAGTAVRVLSAGVEPWDHLHPMAVKVMQERNLDMTAQRPKHVNILVREELDLVVTIGNPARDRTPPFPGNPRRVHWDIDDPADADATPDSEAVFRRTAVALERRLPEIDRILSLPRAAAAHLAPGISSYVFGLGPFQPEKYIPLLAQAGFKCLELNCYLGSVNFPWDRLDQARALKRLCADHGMVVHSVHADGDWLPRKNPRENRWALAMTKAFAEFAVELETHHIVLHVGLPAGVDKETGKAMLRDTLAELEAGILPLPCRFAWENEAAGLTAREHIEWVRRLNPGAFGFVLDTGHSNMHGNTNEYLEGVGPYLCGLHLNDNRRDADTHLHPGEGTFQWQGFLGQVLSQTGYRGPVMLEVARQNRKELSVQLSEARSVIRRLQEDAI